MDRIKFALIGCGRIGQRHAEHIAKVGELVATCDIDPQRASETAKKYCASKHYTSTEALLEAETGVNVVSICSPNGLHAAHAIQALNAGKHVLCEKPMALSVHDCGEMIKAAEKANRRLFIVKQNRFNPPVEAVKNAIDDGKLGKIYSVQLSCFWNRNNEYYRDWKGTRKLDGGTLFTQFSHFIDLLYWMIGDVKSANAFIGNFNHKGVIEFEDCGVVALEFYNGVAGTINYNVNSWGKNMEGSLTIFGELGTIKIGGQYLNELEYQNIQEFEIKNLPPGNPPNNYGQYVGSMSNHDKVYANVIDVLNHEGIIATNGFEGLKTVEIIDKIYSSAKVIA